MVRCDVVWCDDVMVMVMVMALEVTMTMTTTLTTAMTMIVMMMAMAVMTAMMMAMFSFFDIFWAHCREQWRSAETRLPRIPRRAAVLRRL